MKTYLRKYILWLYVFLVTVITCAVFMIGCDGSGGGGGHASGNVGLCGGCSITSDCEPEYRCLEFSDGRWRCAYKNQNTTCY